MHAHTETHYFFRHAPIVFQAQRKHFNHTSARTSKSHNNVMHSLKHPQDKPLQELEGPVLLVEKGIKRLGFPGDD